MVLRQARLPEARSSTPQPLRCPQPCVPCGRRLSTLLKAKPEREGRRWHPLCQLEEVARSIDQVVEVIHRMDGVDSPRRVLCPWRVHPPASTFPAVARATAGRFVRCEWLVRGVRAQDVYHV